MIVEFVLPLFGVQYENNTYAGISRQDAKDKALEAAGEGANLYGASEGETPDGLPAWSDDVCLNQSVNISITGNHLTFTGWSESMSWGGNMFTAAFQ